VKKNKKRHQGEKERGKKKKDEKKREINFQEEKSLIPMGADGRLGDY